MTITTPPKSSNNDSPSTWRDLTRSLRVRLLSTEFSVDPGPSRSIQTPGDAAGLISAFIGRKDREHLVVVHLSTTHGITGLETVGVGRLDGVEAHPREVFKAAILASSAAVIIGHNHPSGDVSPSPEDRATYRSLLAAGDLVC